MARYFFHVVDGTFVADTVGVELESVAGAHGEAAVRASKALTRRERPAAKERERVSCVATIDGSNTDGHVDAMARPSNREKILEQGLRLVGERGLGAASVRDIVSAAGVPLGSFSNHFASKEAFGREVVERYFANRQEVIRDTLLNDEKPPLARLEEYIALSKTKEACGGNHGSLLGTLAAEAGGLSDALRQQLNAIFAELIDAVAYCLEAAVAAREVAPDFDCRTVAGFIVSSHQGAVMLAKTEHSPAPIERLQQVLFSVVLRRLR